MRKLAKTLSLSTAIILLFIKQAFAICPICTIVVGAGVGLSHWLGIDDTITGVWLGGFIVSLIIWTVSWCNKKNIRFKGRKILITLSYYLIIILPLYPMGIMGHPLNKLWGMDKLLLGTLIGSVFFSLGGILYFEMKKRNNGHAHYPFEKVVMPVLPLVILSVIFYFIIRV